MANKTMFSDDELHTIETIAADLRTDGKSEVKVKSFAQSFFLENAFDKTGKVNLVTESWTMAVVQYLMAAGYEIRKRE